MKLLPLLLIALLTVAPVAVTTDVYSFVKTDFGDGSFGKLVDLQDVYTQEATKIVVEFSTLLGSAPEGQSVQIGFGDSSETYTIDIDVPLRVEVVFDHGRICLLYTSPSPRD